VIEIRGLGKKYKSYARRSDRLREWLSWGRHQLHKEFWALKDINLTVSKGQVFGLVGMNGAGKSTLLKILTGTTIPTVGTYHYEGRVAALLELGAGFHGELTGRENVQVNGRLLGLTDEEIAVRIEDIKAFSELGEFFEQPVRTYSSGMYVRLGFSLAVSVDPDVLIIDEALSVGDAYFQQKCLKRIREFKDKGVTILFVSHDAGAIRALCDEVALLDRGQIVGRGHPRDVLELYNALLAKREGVGQDYVVEQSAQGTVSGNKRARIVKVGLLGPNNESLAAATSGDKVKIFVDIDFQDSIENPTVGILIKDRMGYDVFGTNNFEMKVPTGAWKAGQHGRFMFDLDLNLGPGDYTISASTHKGSNHVEECYEWVDRVFAFKVLPWNRFHFLGMALLNPEFKMEERR